LELSYHSFTSEESEVRQVPDDDDAANFVDGSGRVDRGIGPELRHFVDCVRSGQEPLNDGRSARLAVAVCLAAQESILRKETVWLEELG
ncbi:MAG: gfo/Idh/MocA family oxidoreductase, partial [Verrucomicrobiota bacterium]